VSPTPAPVLIVGGGPTGTTLAIELMRRGVPCRVLDSADGPVHTSRSFTLHARTLELFEMANLADRFLERGLPSVSMDYHFQGIDEPARLDFSQLDSRYPYTLIINQNITERTLREHLAELGTPVEWSTELRSISPESDGSVTATLVHHPSGRSEAVPTDWLVGCDGVQSTVRSQLDIPYEGDEYEGMRLRMLDVPLDGFSMGDDRIHYFVSEERLLLITKLPGANYRVLISDMQGNPPTETVRTAFQNAVDIHFQGKVTLGEPEWATSFRSWRRVTPAYRHGRVFLAGDAAHCHSPAGGQGMNACIQDAFNLGWKLAMVVRTEAHESLLDSYEPERRPIAQQVIEGTDALHAIIMAHGISIPDRIKLSREPGFTQEAIGKISGLDYNYRSAMGVPVEDAIGAGVVAGDRAPDVPIADGRRLHELLRHPGYTLLLLPKDDPGPELDTLAGEVAQRYGATVRVELITGDDRSLDRYAPAGGDAFCLVRPDGYVRLCARISDRDTLLAVLGADLRREPCTS